MVCNELLSMSEADIVDTGYRCARCSMLATAEPRVRALPRRGFAIGGLVLVALAAAMWIANWDIDMPDDDGGTSLWMFVVFGAIACIAIATRPRE